LVRSHELNQFTNDDVRILGIISSQSAQIMSNAILLEELAQNNDLLKLSQQQIKAENIELKKQINTKFTFENIIGKSESIKKVLTLASKAGKNNSPVLITGPTGSGKELVAQAIHYNSQRKDQPFVVKNCGVKTESLLESELFGHTKGSFTGADRDKPGLFKESDGGTIFLDEIGDAPMSTQAAILRVLESGEIRPIGASKTLFVDVRLISATNHDLIKLIEKNEFREDLFYRLNTITIELPPLKHRREDIPILIDHFLARQKLKLDNKDLIFSHEAFKALTEYDWPGNVRQLIHEIERASVVCEDENIIDLADLSQTIIDSLSKESASDSSKGKLKEMVEQVEKETIYRTLVENKWNILKTSRELGLTRKGLKDKINRYNIKSDDN
jgi:transcriptional regulator with PAS, ATPase and Fis domain